MKPRLSVRQERYTTTFKVRANPFHFVVVKNHHIEKHGAAMAIRLQALKSAANGNVRAADKHNAIADILDGVTT